MNTSSEIYRSSSGASVDHAAIQDTTENLQGLLVKLQVNQPPASATSNTLSSEQTPLSKIAQACESTATELIKQLENLKDLNPILELLILLLKLSIPFDSLGNGCLLVSIVLTWIVLGKGSPGKWSSFRTALLSVWSEKDIKGTSDRLEGYRGELSINILVSLWYDCHANIAAEFGN